jgi:hypothetical protein
VRIAAGPSVAPTHHESLIRRPISVLRYVLVRSDDGFWIYNLDSKALGMKTGESYRLNIFIGSTQVTTS